jgi:hypothetical protein
MDDARTRINAPAVALAILAGLLAVYVMSYYLLGKSGLMGGLQVRVYQSKWQADLYIPAAKVESLLVGHEVGTAHLDP